jgi:phage protein D
MREAALPPSDFLAGAFLSGDAVRSPQLTVLANGAPLAGMFEAEVISNNHFAADRFRVSAALHADPLAGLTVIDTDSITIDVQVALGVFDGTSLVQGEVDTIEVDPINGLLHLEGRDLSAALIQARTQETFANNTSSEIAQKLAARHGLAADVQATTTPAGRYWELEHDRIVLNQFGRATTEWDLLVTLAQFEGFDLWVTGTTLHFRPPVAVPVATAVLRPAATLAGPANVMGLRLERALTLARDINVTVKSWNSRQRNAFTQSAQRSGTGTQSGNVLNYVYVVPNLSADDALKYAQARLAELTLHERVICAEMPGELTLFPRAMVRVEGTGTRFDQAYWIDRVERRFSLRDGFVQTVHARNVTSPGQATAPADIVGATWINS